MLRKENILKRKLNHTKKTQKLFLTIKFPSSLITSVEILETKNDDLGKQYEDMKHLLEIERRKNERIIKEQTSQKAELNSVKLRHVNSYHESTTIDPDIDEVIFL